MYACAQHVCSCGNEIYSDGDAGKLPSPQGNLEQNPTTVLDIQGVFVADFRVNKIPVGVKMLTGQDGEPALETVRVCARSRARLCMFVYVCVCLSVPVCVTLSVDPARPGQQKYRILEDSSSRGREKSLTVILTAGERLVNDAADTSGSATAV